MFSVSLYKAMLIVGSLDVPNQAVALLTNGFIFYVVFGNIFSSKYVFLSKLY